MTPLFRSKSVISGPREAMQSEVPKILEAELAAVYYGQRLGGDLYDFVRVSSSRVLFGLLDVAGHIEENQHIVTAAQTTFRTSGTELLADDEANEAEAVVGITHQINRAIMQAAGGVRACPAFVGCYNEGLGTVCYVNLGHTPGLLQDAEGIEELQATGLPLGLFSHATTDACMIGLEPGARLLLVSKGVVEAKCRGEEYGLAGVKQTLSTTASEPAKNLCFKVLEQLQTFLCRPPTDNDVTALALAKQIAVKAAAQN